MQRARGAGAWALGGVVALALGVAGEARADEKDRYLLVSVGPSLLRTTNAFAPERLTARRVEPLLGLSAYWGWTDTLHVGAALHGTWARGLRYPGAEVPLSTCAAPAGTLYEDVRSVSLGAFVHYRHDSGEAWAPFLQAELGGGLTSRVARRQAIAAPSGSRLYAEDVESAHALVPQGALQAGFEWRVADAYSVALGVQVRVNPLERSTWRLQVPLTVGGVFR